MYQIYLTVDLQYEDSKEKQKNVINSDWPPFEKLVHKKSKLIHDQYEQVCIYSESLFCKFSFFYPFFKQVK